MLQYYLLGGEIMTMSEKRKKYLLDYQKEKVRRIPLNVSFAKYDEIKKASEAAGESVNGYIKKAIDLRLSVDGVESVPEE